MVGIDGSEKTVTTLSPRDVIVFFSFVLRAVSIHAVDDHQAKEYDSCGNQAKGYPHFFDRSPCASKPSIVDEQQDEQKRDKEKTRQRYDPIGIRVPELLGYG